MPDNQGLVTHLTRYGKLDSEEWSYLATKFGFETGEKARKHWSHYKNTKGKEGVKEERAEYVSRLENAVSEFLVEGDKGQIRGAFDNEIKTLEELIDKCKIDIKTWKVDRYVQNYWGNTDHPHWQVKAWLSKITEKDTFQQEFMKFLAGYAPSLEIDRPIDASSKKPKCCLIINKQDEHINKFDIGGENNMDARWVASFTRTEKILIQSSSTNYIEKIIYIVGSDQFNSEWTKATTKGTPQENVLPYQEAFEKVCNYEVQSILNLLRYSDKVEIVFVSGNHDEYVGWHLISWLKAYFKEVAGLSFDISPKYRKYKKYGNTAIMFNHGDVMKPEQLASVFPQEFKDQWSECKFQYIFTGDKHHELSKDMNGIQLYQLSALSTASSLWDDKRGFSNSKRELTAFLIDEKEGLVNIYKRPI